MTSAWGEVLKIDRTRKIIDNNCCSSGGHSCQPAGRQRHELMAEMCSFAQARYVVFFIAKTDGIEIVRVLHSACDITVDDFES
jgi:hypothetical protein